MKLRLIKDVAWNPSLLSSMSNRCRTDVSMCKAFSIPISGSGNTANIYLQIEIPKVPDIINSYWLSGCGANTTVQTVGYSNYSLFKLKNGNWLLTLEYQSVTAPSGTCFTPLIEIFYLNSSSNYDPYYGLGDTYCVEDCEDVSVIETCYKEGAFSQSNYDANGIYYGLPNDEYDIIYGDPLLKYKHIYTVRNLTKKSNGLKTNIVKANFKTINTSIERNTLVNIADEIPYYYAKYLQVVFSNGTFTIDNDLVNYYEAEELTINEISKCCETYHVQVAVKEVYNNAVACKTCLQIDDGSGVAPCYCVAYQVTNNGPTWEVHMELRLCGINPDPQLSGLPLDYNTIVGTITVIMDINGVQTPVDFTAITPKPLIINMGNGTNASVNPASLIKDC